ncbi:DUF975 family protein [bacterium]|nr:DUF975 family protein [bacterium]
MNIFRESRNFKNEAKSRLNAESFGVYFLATLVIVGLAVVESIVQYYLLGESILNKILNILYNIFITSAFNMGLVFIAVGIYRGKAAFGMLLKPFGGSLYWKVVKLYILTGLRVFVYSLLLIVPGIMLAYSYSMSNYIFEENPDLAVSEILERSEKMMKGHRWELFLFQMSFAGWFLLAICTLGLASVYVAPYFAVSHVGVYNALKRSEENILEG